MYSIKIPDYGKHIMFLGSTGSGKSYLAEKMLKGVKRYFIFALIVSSCIAFAEIHHPASTAALVHQHKPEAHHKHHGQKRAKDGGPPGRLGRQFRLNLHIPRTKCGNQGRVVRCDSSKHLSVL